MKKNLETSVYEALHALCDGKRNQEEVAKSLHVSQSYLNRLLNRKRPVSGMTLDFVQRMFPNATLNLNGDISQTGTNNGFVGVNNGTVNSGPIPDSISRSVLESMILHADDFTAEERVKFLVFLKEKVCLFPFLLFFLSLIITIR